MERVEKEPIATIKFVAEKFLATIEDALSVVAICTDVESVEIKAIAARRLPVEILEIVPEFAFKVLTEKLEKTPKGDV